MSSGRGGGGIRRGLWWDRGGRDGDWGCTEHDRAGPEPSERGRRAGAGGKPAVSKDTPRLAHLEALVEPTTRGDPESPLRWTCKSVRRLAQALQAQGHEVSRTLVAELLNHAGYSLQGQPQDQGGR